MAHLVRLATADDAEAVRRVGEAAFADHRGIYQPNDAAVANLATLAPALERLVAESSNAIVGTVRFGRAGGVMRVIGLAVHPRWRLRGVARALIDAVHGIARIHQCRVLSLYTVVQTGNVPIFRSLGFYVVAEEPDEYSVSVTGEPLMEARMERSVE